MVNWFPIKRNYFLAYNPSSTKEWPLFFTLCLNFHYSKHDANDNGKSFHTFQF